MISVILPTHNGCGTLHLTLEEFTKLYLPREGVEFIVVNNASTDLSQGIIDSFRNRLFLKVLFEPRQGKSFAVNTGIKFAQGDLLVFTDDDVLPDKAWLTSYAKAAEDYPEASIFGGQVRHFWQKDPPKWLVRLAEEGRAYGGTPIYIEDGPLNPKFVKGANLMVRREVLEKIRFSEESGRNFSGQSTSQGGEDVDFAARTVAAGFTLRYIRGATVKHIVRRNEVSLFPLVKRSFRIGKSTVSFREVAYNRQVATLFGYPRYYIRETIFDFTKACLLWCIGKHYSGADTFIRLSFRWGQLCQEKQYRKSPRER
jgi:glycosyltransferase involved in cell wall biosynthesis